MRDVALDVTEGEALGIIGNNGAGKSTLLKIVAGVTYPTRGEVVVRGRVGAMVDVGAGMHPDLTGFENIFLYGTILGLSRWQIRQKFDQIVAFSELEPFLDVPVKRYSSGMKIRLGFSVAAHLDPDILLIDEVLAVGDLAFQRKCVDRIRELQRAGTTIVFVSHDLSAVERVTQRTVLIGGGQIQDVGRSHEVIRRYREVVDRAFIEAARGRIEGRGALDVERVVLTDTAGVEQFEFRPGDRVVVNLYYRVRDAQLPLELALKVVDESYTTILMAHSNSHVKALALVGEGIIRCTFQAPPLAPKTYQLWGQVLRLPDYREEVPWQPVAAFAIVRPEGRSQAGTAWGWEQDTPVLEVPVRWALNGHAPGRRKKVVAATEGAQGRSGTEAGDLGPPTTESQAQHAPMQGASVQPVSAPEAPARDARTVVYRKRHAGQLVLAVVIALMGSALGLWLGAWR
ncbi:MAG: polysaccharide ABC transporter ATP-binding protein [Armatimonadota bacterium]|nr:polysaccharide ABC transporter ATP-binding protein [Armatimonadota bacterium]